MLREIIENCVTSSHDLAACDTDGRGKVINQLTYGELYKYANSLAYVLREMNANQSKDISIGILAKNTTNWLVMDLAIMLSGYTEVPIPILFSKAQARNLLSECDCILVDKYGAEKLHTWKLQSVKIVEVSSEYLESHQAEKQEVKSFKKNNIAKVIHTSGTTNTPKGVKISWPSLSEKVQSLLKENTGVCYQHYLSLLPASLLLEQAAGYYQALLQKGCIYFTSVEHDMVGSISAHEAYFIDLMVSIPCTASILTPSLVDALYSRVKENEKNKLDFNPEKLFKLKKIPYLGVGGANVCTEQLKYLSKQGVEVYQGYGLSENCSVATINRIGDNKIGSIGKPLKDVEVQLADDGELLIRSRSLFDGYTTHDPSSCFLDESGWLHTGDLVCWKQGYMYFQGRKKNILIASNGRNISPKWVAEQYMKLSYVKDVILELDSKGRLSAEIFIDKNTDLENAKEEIAAFNENNFSDIEKASKFNINYLS